MSRVSITIHDSNGRGENFHATKHSWESTPERTFFKVIFTLDQKKDEDMESFKARVRKELSRHNILTVTGLDSIV